MEKETITEWLDRWFIKRPYPKALDADGVETKVGDTVYLIDHYDEDLSEYHGVLQVMEIRSIGCSADPFFVVANEEGIATDLGHELFTHERPVFDADGVRICKGDTVWHASGESNAWVVERIGEDGAVFCREENYSMAVPFDANRLTHREPESLEKLLERMEEYAQKNEGYIDGSKVGDFSKELRALIERGA